METTYLQAMVGDPEYYKVCGALFVCGSPMENDVHTEWVNKHDVERAKLAELGQEIYPRERQTPEALHALQRAEIAKWWPIIKAGNLKVE